MCICIPKDGCQGYTDDLIERTLLKKEQILKAFSWCYFFCLASLFRVTKCVSLMLSNEIQNLYFALKIEKIKTLKAYW